MSNFPKEMRRTLQRLRRTVEKAEREMSALERMLANSDDPDLPTGDYADARHNLRQVGDFVDRETGRLKMKVLEGGGIEPDLVQRRMRS